MLPVALVHLSLAALAAARLHHSRVPEDPFAFPKYRVSFLNGLPLLNETAERWLEDGLRGGELEFLDQPWRESPWPANPLKSIEGSDDPSPDVCTPCALLLVRCELMGPFRAGSLDAGFQVYSAANEARSKVLVLVFNPSTAEGFPRGRRASDRGRHTRA